MANQRLDGLSPLEQTLLVCVQRLVLAPMDDLHIRVVSFDTAVSQADNDPLGHTARVLQQVDGLLELLAQDMAVIRVAGEAACAHHQALLVRYRQADLRAELIRSAGLAFGVAFDLRSVQRIQLVLEFDRLDGLDLDGGLEQLFQAVLAQQAPKAANLRGIARAGLRASPRCGVREVDHPQLIQAACRRIAPTVQLAPALVSTIDLVVGVPHPPNLRAPAPLVALCPQAGATPDCAAAPRIVDTLTGRSAMPRRSARPRIGLGDGPRNRS